MADDDRFKRIKYLVLKTVSVVLAFQTNGLLIYFYSNIYMICP